MVDPLTGLGAADLRRRPGGLLLGRQWRRHDQRGDRHGGLAVELAERQPPDHAVLLRRRAAEQRRGPDRRRALLRPGPGRRLPAVRPERLDQRQHSLDRPHRRRHRRGDRPDRIGHPLPVQLAVLRRQQHRLLPGHHPPGHQSRRPHQWPDPVPRTRPAVALRGRVQLRGQPDQRQADRHQLRARPDLPHRGPGPELAGDRRPGRPRRDQRPGDGLRRPRPGPDRRLARQLHLRRHQRRPHLRHLHRRRRERQQLDQHLRPGSTARASSRSSPTRRGPRTTPTPSPTMASTSSPTPTPPPARPGRRSPATSSRSRTTRSATRPTRKPSSSSSPRWPWTGGT